jgi:PAS domain S-box-containing protein
MLLPFTLIEIIIITLILAIGVVLISIRKKGEIGYSSILAFGVCLIVSALFYSALLGGLMEPTLLLEALLYLIVLGLPVSVLVFSLEYLEGRKWLSVAIVGIIALVPVLIQSFLISRATQGFLFINEPTKNFEIISQLDAMGWLNHVYSTGILIAALIVLAYSIDFRLPIRQNRAVITIFIAGILSVFISMINFSNLVPVTEPMVLLSSFSIVGIAFIYYRVVFDIKKISRVYKNKVLDHLEDGIIVLNGSDYVIGMNLAAEQIVGVTAQEAYGRHIDRFFQDWQRISLNRDSENETEFRGSVYIHQEWRYLDVRITPMESENSENKSKILIIRDITNLKITNDARQYAREAMFVFLRSLFNAFKDSQTIQEFLERALYQTLYTFNIENGFIYLLVPSNVPERAKYALAAKHGSMNLKSILAKILSSACLSLSDTKREPQIIADVKKDKQLSEYFRDMNGDFSLAFFPLCVEQEVLGLMVLGRAQVNGFNPYDVMRLGVAADEIASYIFKERERQQQIASIERQRLVRDLHDSVTQKLYGLVTITEAVQVGLEAGAIDKATNLMSRVSENARQALREMRLFLHQLDPVDLEREGLVAALHQRLAAVEGRSDIKAQFISKGEFSFSKEKERAIYYIAEEALNNILKHAQAQTVSVKLRRRGGRVYLDIIDDGCGYDPTKQPGGRGIRNMIERAAQMEATFTIVPEKRKGTRVSLSFRE